MGLLLHISLMVEVSFGSKSQQRMDNRRRNKREVKEEQDEYFNFTSFMHTSFFSSGSKDACTLLHFILKMILWDKLGRAYVTGPESLSKLS